MAIKMNLSIEETLYQTTVTLPIEIGAVLAKDYRNLYNKPEIEGIELLGNKTLEELGIEKMSNKDIFNLLGGKRNG